jgi:hypothetical protein
MFKKILLVLILINFGCSTAKVNNKKVMKVQIDVTYSESADIFVILDNVSGWWEGFTEAEYKKYWVIRFGISTNDDVLFGQYVKLRWKYYNDPDQKPKDPLKNRNGLFSTIGSVTSDPLAESFYSSNSLDESYIKLKGLVSKELIYL